MALGKKTGGRVAGTPNKVSKALKDMILGALDAAGGEKYLLEQAERNPQAFLTLVGKVLPSEISGANGGPIRFQGVCKVVRAASRE